MADRLETLFAEVGPLAQVRDQCNGLVTRAGLLIGANAVAASVLIAKMEKAKSGEIAAFTLPHRAVVRIAAQIQRDRARHTGSRPRSAAAPATVRLGPNL